MTKVTNNDPFLTKVQIRDGTGQDFLDPTGKFQNHRRLTGRSTVFLQKVFVHCLMFLMKFFQTGRGTGEVLKFVTLDGGLRKKRERTFAFFAKMT